MNACAQIKQPSHKWDSDETDLFCEILADPVNNFMENLKRERGARKHSTVIFDSIIAEFKGLENVKFKEKKKEKNFKAKIKKANWWAKIKAFL